MSVLAQFNVGLLSGVVKNMCLLFVNILYFGIINTIQTKNIQFYQYIIIGWNGFKLTEKFCLEINIL